MPNGVEQGVTKRRFTIVAAECAIGVEQQPPFKLAWVALLFAFL
jgi:hypothetical protein